MGAIINIAMATTLSAGPTGAVTALQGPFMRANEGIFVEDGLDDTVQFFEKGAELPPNAERMAVLTRSGLSGHTVRVLPGVENDLRLIAERPHAFDLYVPEFEGQEVDGVVAVVQDEDGYPLAFVTTQRNDILAVVVSSEDGQIEIVEQDPESAFPMDIAHDEMVIGVLTPNARGGLNALMDDVHTSEVQVLLEMFRPSAGDWIPGQN